MKGMVTPLPSFITKFMAILAITFQDKDAFLATQCVSYVVRNELFRMTKLPHSCLVSSKKHPLSQASVECQQTLKYEVID